MSGPTRLLPENSIRLASEIRGDLIASGSALRYLPGTFEGACEALDEACEYYIGEFTHDDRCQVPEVLHFDRSRLPSNRPLFHMGITVAPPNASPRHYQSALLVLRHRYRILVSHFIQEKHWQLNPVMGISDRGCPMQLHFMMPDEEQRKNLKTASMAMLAQTLVAYNALTSETPTDWFKQAEGPVN